MLLPTAASYYVQIDERRQDDIVLPLPLPLPRHARYTNTSTAAQVRWAIRIRHASHAGRGRCAGLRAAPAPSVRHQRRGGFHAGDTYGVEEPRRGTALEGSGGPRRRRTTNNLHAATWVQVAQIKPVRYPRFLSLAWPRLWLGLACRPKILLAGACRATEPASQPVELWKCARAWTWMVA